MWLVGLEVKINDCKVLWNPRWKVKALCKDDYFTAANVICSWWCNTMEMFLSWTPRSGKGTWILAATKLSAPVAHSYITDPDHKGEVIKSFFPLVFLAELMCLWWVWKCLDTPAHHTTHQNRDGITSDKTTSTVGLKQVTNHMGKKKHLLFFCTWSLSVQHVAFLQIPGATADLHHTEGLIMRRRDFFGFFASSSITWFLGTQSIPVPLQLTLCLLPAGEREKSWVSPSFPQLCVPWLGQTLGWALGQTLPSS